MSTKSAAGVQQVYEGSRMREQAKAPEVSVSRWFNTAQPITLAGLMGRPVLIHAFQMLCPGCVSHGTPQAERAHRLFAGSDLSVIGLHTVFEHHAAMTPVSLEAFILEYQLTFPIGVDEASGVGSSPVTMKRFGMRGTPTTVLVGRDGGILHHGFGMEDDMALGAMISSALGSEKREERLRAEVGATRVCRALIDSPHLVVA